MKCQCLSDWPVPVFKGLQCIIRKEGPEKLQKRYQL